MILLRHALKSAYQALSLRNGGITTSNTIGRNVTAYLSDSRQTDGHQPKSTGLPECPSDNCKESSTNMAGTGTEIRLYQGRENNNATTNSNSSGRSDNRSFLDTDFLAAGSGAKCEISRMLEVLEGIKAGKQIQQFRHGRWMNISNVSSMNFHEGEYRVKPKPRKWRINVNGEEVIVKEVVEQVRKPLVEAAENLLERMATSDSWGKQVDALVAALAKVKE